MSDDTNGKWWDLGESGNKYKKQIIVEDVVVTKSAAKSIERLKVGEKVKCGWWGWRDKEVTIDANGHEIEQEVVEEVEGKWISNGSKIDIIEDVDFVVTKDKRLVVV